MKFNEIFASTTKEKCRTQDVLPDMNENGIKDLQAILEEFEQEGSLSPAFWFWDDFLKHVMLPIKLFIASSRFGVWEVNQYAKVKFLPIVFATNRSIYSKYMSYMILQRKHLLADVMDGFQEGLFFSKLSEEKVNSVWIDYVLEANEKNGI